MRSEKFAAQFFFGTGCPLNPPPICSLASLLICAASDTVGQIAERFDIDGLAYVLMDHHYHLLLRTHRANLCRSMQCFGAT
jgi:hypothetical protein